MAAAREWTMWRSSRSDRQPRRGFTLLEAMVSLLLLVIVLIVAMTMLFEMRAFAERQQYFMLPRQTARRAADYLSFYFAGAGYGTYIAPPAPSSPNALIMYYNLNGAVKQASYNNLTGNPGDEPGNGPRTISAKPPAIPADIASTNFGDIGTDVITMVVPLDIGRYQVSAPFPTPLGSNKDLYFNFRVGCNCVPPACVPADDANNLTAFRAATGDDAVNGSALLMLLDRNGNWSYIQIPETGYQADGRCNSPFPVSQNIRVNPVDTASLTLPAPPGGAAALTDPVFLITGLQVISFRVLTDDVDGLPKLQQKLGLFDPNADNPYPPVAIPPLPSFTNVMEGVEDLQVAYMYGQDAAAALGTGDNPFVWNTASQTINVGCPAPGCNVPPQAGPTGAAATLDITNVIGVRVSVTGRSPLLPLAAQKMTDVDVKNPLATTSSQHFRPVSEDHDVTDPPQYDKFDHYRATATLLLRNRIPRG